MVAFHFRFKYQTFSNKQTVTVCPSYSIFAKINSVRVRPFSCFPFFPLLSPFSCFPIFLAFPFPFPFYCFLLFLLLLFHAFPFFLLSQFPLFPFVSFPLFLAFPFHTFSAFPFSLLSPFPAFPSNRFFACLPRCLLAIMTLSLLTSLEPYLTACSPAFSLPCLLANLLAFLFAFMPPCLPALPAYLTACLFACLGLHVYFSASISLFLDSSPSPFPCSSPFLFLFPSS